MKLLTTAEIIDATGGRVLCSGPEEFIGLSIDSRTIQEGELFLALRGERLDGHDFLRQALAKGAGTIVNRDRLQTVAEGISQTAITEKDLPAGKTIIAVEDTLRALHDMARGRRRGFPGPVIGVVGSNGKTTTKELVVSILNTRIGVIKTAGNFNNHIGLPLCMVRGGRDAGAMVLEMGTNRPGDVSLLCGIARPDLAVITNIGCEHLEGFGSIEKVRDSELEILPFLKSLVMNADDAFLMEGINGSFGGVKVTFGIDAADAGVRAQDISFHDTGTKFSLWCEGGRIEVNSRLFGRFNVYNCLGAAAAGLALGYDLDEIRRGLESFAGVPMRFEVRRRGATTFLNDVYNANPSSVEESLKEFVRVRQGSPHGRGIVVLGDMLELGDYGPEAHRRLGRLISGLPVDCFIGVGPLMSLAVSEFGGSGIVEATSEEAGNRLGGLLREGDTVLIKGSRGMRMERVLETLEKLETETLPASGSGGPV